MRCLARGALAWVLIAAAETVHGVARGLFLAPRVGDLASRQIGVLTGSALILVIAWLLGRWIGATSRAQLLAVGTVWLVLMVAFEVGLGRALGLPWDRIASDYDPRQGGMMALGMAVLFLAPLLAARARGRGNSGEQPGPPRPVTPAAEAGRRRP